MYQSGERFDPEDDKAGNFLLTVLVCGVACFAARAVARRFLAAPTEEYVSFFVLIFTAQASALLWRRPPPGLIGRNLLSSLLGAAIAVAALWAIERFIPAFAT